MKLLSSKKGDLGLSLKQIIGLVLAFAVILMTLGLFFGLLNIFTAKADPGSIRNFNMIFDSVEALYDERNTQHEACILQNEFLRADWAVVGFNADCVRTADNDFYCVHGDECVEEQCSGLFSGESNIDKPSWCGTGPCICLCNGGVVGDIDGDDCAEDNANCRKFPPDSKFRQFYFIDPDKDECKDPESKALNKMSILDINRPGTFCDLVIDSENCGGTDRGVVYALVISKTKSLSPVKQGCTMASGHDAIVFDLVYNENQFKAAYKEDMIKCDDLIREMMKAPEQEPQKEPEKKEEKPEAEKGASVVDELQQPAVTAK